MATINLNKLLFIILLIKSSLFVDALKCYQCGMYNDGVGSITPCLNYTETTAPNYLKDCPKSSDNYCIKYKSDMSVVRDCVKTCQEKEVWNTQTFCCNEDGCNDALTINKSSALARVAIAAVLYFSIALLSRQ